MVFLRRCIQILLVLAAFWVGGLVWFTMSIPRTVPTQVAPADGIVVLTGGRGRLQPALDLLAQDIGKRLLITGVSVDVSDATLRENLVQGNRTQDLGFVPEVDKPPVLIDEATYDCCVDTGRLALDTRGNALEIKSWAAKRGYSRIVVVTDAYHMPRSMVELRQIAPELELKAYPVFMPHIKLKEWWAYQGTSQLLANEYNKYIASLVRARLVGSLQEATGT